MKSQKFKTIFPYVLSIILSTVPWSLTASFPDELWENDVDLYTDFSGYEDDLHCSAYELDINYEIEDEVEYYQPKGFVKPAHIPQEVWDVCAPYFLPVDHPIKPALDKIFGAYPRAIHSSVTLHKAGFKNTKPGRWSHTIVCKHRKLDGYFIKLYSDTQLGYKDWEKLTRRIQGAQFVQAALDANGWNNYFKVPKKWIYPLPENPPSKKSGVERKNFILIAEDMNIISEVQNLIKWKSENLPKKTLDLVFQLLKAEGLKDSAYVPNLPFAKDGRIAIIDTEYFHVWPVPYHRLCKFLSEKNCAYWQGLIKSDGP